MRVQSLSWDRMRKRGEFRIRECNRGVGRVEVLRMAHETGWSHEAIE